MFKGFFGSKSEAEQGQDISGDSENNDFSQRSRNPSIIRDTDNNRSASLNRSFTNDEGSQSNMISGQNNTTRSGLLNVFGRSGAAADAEMERKVSTSAQRLGEGVQSIVLAAKMGRQERQNNNGSNAPVEWRMQLLILLGGSDSEVENGNYSSDIDILLENASCTRFVLRCVEHEVPPNLIHCLRLLRVLELQHAHAAAAANQRANTRGSIALKPMSKVATAKVSELLCLLCTDPVVGRQLKPHLFGLLALSGASYPPSGVHVASAASNVIVAFSKSCLSRSLVWFLHERKMISHMTDDVKELCGMTEIAQPASSTLCLYGAAAEDVGLWLVALKTVVNLVVHSCNHQCVELVKDFDTAGGYHVLCYGIHNSGPDHIKKLMDLVIQLACCKTEVTNYDDNMSMTTDVRKQHPDFEEEIDINESNLVTNPNAIAIIADLMVRFVPFLTNYAEQNNNAIPTFQADGLNDLVESSLEIVLQSESSNIQEDDKPDFDMARELLVSTLQLYSDHAENYTIIESEYQILSRYLLSFPTFKDVHTKLLVLRLLEYVCTGLPGSDFSVPLRVMTAMFFCYCKILLYCSSPDGRLEANSIISKKMIDDIMMLCASFEKLLQFDINISDYIVHDGFFNVRISEILSVVQSLPSSQLDTADNNGAKNLLPPKETNADESYIALCRILKLFGPSAMTCIVSSFDNSINVSAQGDSRQSEYVDDMIELLGAGVLTLGTAASDAALAVFEAKMVSCIDDFLKFDMMKVLELLDNFSNMAGTSLGLNFTNSKNTKKGPRSSSLGSINDMKKKEGIIQEECINRLLRILQVLKVVLESNELAQDVFRTCNGFEYLIKLLYCMKGSVYNVTEESNEIQSGKEEVNEHKQIEDYIDSKVAKIMKSLVKASLDVLDAAITPCKRHQRNSGELYTVSKSIDVISENDKPQSPSAVNRDYIRNKAFYISFASVISGTGLLVAYVHARDILNYAFKLVDPHLIIPPNTDDEQDYHTASKDCSSKSTIPKALSVQNADASRLVLGLTTFLPHSEMGKSLGRRALDELLQLCANEKAGTSLAQLSTSGICISLTSSIEFSTMLEDPHHHLYSRFVLLLRRIASFNMSYVDFVSLLRCVAGPVLLTECDDGIADNISSNISKTKRIRLPVITASISNSPKCVNDSIRTESWHSREASLCNRLTLLADIAERGDRVTRCLMGGDSLNTIALYMQKVKVHQRLYTLAEQGKINFLEVESVDAAASFAASSLNNAAGGTNTPSSAAIEKVWAPLTTTGFSFSIWLRLPPGGYDTPGNIFILDLSSSLGDNNGGSNRKEFISVWYDILSQRFNVLSSVSNKPTSFPVVPLVSRVWHHILLTFQAPKRTMLSRKSVLSICVDGRALEADIKTDVVQLPPTARMLIGAPNPELASSGIIRGPLPVWELGSTLLVSTILTPRDATSMYAAGPDFNGLFWGDRPQRFSLAATATATFAMLAESGEQGSVAGALRRRGVPEVEAAGHVMRDSKTRADKAIVGSESDSLLGGGLLCQVAPEFVICCFNGSASTSSIQDGSSRSNKRHYSRRLVNVARINLNGSVSTDGVVYGYGSIVSPHCFANNIQWVGGPNVLMPIVNAARSPMTMALALRLIRESVHRHAPNLEMLQAGGGYRILGLLLRQKMIDSSVLDQCFAFAVHGFVPESMQKANEKYDSRDEDLTWNYSDRWVFSDLDAMKYLLLNHQVWDLRGSGPHLPLRLLSFLNGLVAAHSAHAAFNSRRLHLLGIIRWTLHLMLEAAEFYTLGTDAALIGNFSGSPDDDYRTNVDISATSLAAYKSGWYIPPPLVASTALGGDPGNQLLLGCKTLLRRVLTYMLTPGDLEAIANAAIYTVSIEKQRPRNFPIEGSKQNPFDQTDYDNDKKLMPGPVARVYLVRLLEELVVDGVNEIVTTNNENSKDSDRFGDNFIQPHSGGGRNQNQMAMMAKRRSNSKGYSPIDFADHKQAQAFLSAFAGILTPVWFACILEGCREEASASAVFRLMILMLQSSPSFAKAFEDSGGFAPLVLSIPKFSTCASIITAMLSQLMHAPILHLPSFSSLDSTQLCEFFDVESDSTELTLDENMPGGINSSSDPSCGIFALLAECLGRNIQLAACDNDSGSKAKTTNDAILDLLNHRHTFSSAFQSFCRTPDFLEPLAQALCLVHDEKLRGKDEDSSSNDDSILDDILEGKTINNVNNYESDGEQFVAWPTAKQEENLSKAEKKETTVTKIRKRRGSLSTINTEITATQRFVGKVQSDAGRCGIGMIQLLRLVLSNAVLSGGLAAPLVAALFRSFPIHASPKQVQAFHLVLIDHCKTVVEDSLQRGTQLALSNCVGVSSVLLDRLMAGFFTSEPILETVKIILSILSCLSTTGTYASRTLGTAEQSMLVADASHVARLTCLAALTRSRPMGPFDEGDDDLKLAVLDLIGSNLRQLLLVPQLGNSSSSRRGTGSGYMSPPATGTRLHQLWESASLTRCIPSTERCTYPDSASVEEPDKAFIVALMADVHVMLSDKRNDIRVQAVSTIISLLQQRKGIMSELLISDITRPDGRVETIDLINRGGFSSLYVQLEATPLAENPTTDFIRKKNQRGSTITSGSKMYDQFFEWLERNNTQVSAVFRNIHVQASRLFATMDTGASTPEEAIENEQKTMLLKLTLQDSSDKTILGGLERAELAQRSHERTAESHTLWKSQGFDDLSSGAMQWKFLLRQLKGSCSIWEGGSNNDYNPPFSASSILNYFAKKNSNNDDEDSKPKMLEKEKSRELIVHQVHQVDQVVTRWKLDLTEGYERQRRRMLPNYEFHGLYNVDEGIDDGDNQEKSSNSSLNKGDNDSSSNGQATEEESTSKLSRTRRNSMLELSAEAMEATAQLLKDMQLGTTQMNEDDDFDPEDRDYNEEIGEDMSIGQDMVRDFDQLNDVASTTGKDELSPRKSIVASESNTQLHDDGKSYVEEVRDDVLASSYDLITGLLQPGESYEKLYNVKRCTGLEVRQALLLWCQNAIYVIDGFERTDGEGLEGKINRLETTTSTYYINLRPREFNDDQSEGKDTGVASNRNDDEKTSPEKQKKEQVGQSQSENNITYQHRCQRLAFRDIYSVYRRRYQLQQNALEFYDIHKNGILLAFLNHSDREEVLTKVLSSPLSNSIFSSNVLGSGTSINYQKFMNGLRLKITNKWLQGKITNFDFIMHLNNFAGRSYNDLTQYPVFPWVIADYESEELNLSDPKTFRDLSKPMGAQSEQRAQQFRERFEALEGNHMNGDEPPPFHYGTHYSCAAYVLYYLMRLEPFSRLALSLQGGRFDVADRLFHNIGSSWKSASSENLQDVRELIPEFYYLPQFLVNSNMFDFGTTQLGKTVHHVTLPKWAKGDPNRFIRLNRMALESDYVSRHLHKWVDLIFGYKQRGREAANALNTFVHVTYEGNVDLDRISDPIQRDSIIAQIQNFGQTPSRLVRKPFPARNVMVALKGDYIDFSSLTHLSHLTPPFCIVGAPHRTYLKCITWENCKVGMTGQPDSAVGDICLVRGQLLGVGRTCALITPSKKYYRYGCPNNGVSVHIAATVGTKVNKVLTIHDGLHRAPITCLKPSLNGMWVVTGCMDSTVRVWKYEDDNLKLHASLCGHEGGKITCIDVSTTFGSIVTGGVDGNVLLWDLRTLTFLRKLIHTERYSDRNGLKSSQSVAAVSVSCNHKNGNILTLVGSNLSIFDINGNLVAKEVSFVRSPRQLHPSCAISTNCVEWLEDGIAAVTGHVNGEIKLWSIDYGKQSLNLRHTVQNTIHSCPITCLRTVDQQQDTLLVGDVSGKMSMWKTLQLESLKPEELAPVIEEVKSGVLTKDWICEKNKNNVEEEDGVNMI